MEFILMLILLKIVLSVIKIVFLIIKRIIFGAGEGRFKEQNRNVYVESKKRKSNMMNNQHLFDQHLFDQHLLDEQNRRFMEESLKSVTPFEHGGYDMHNGNSFNNFM